MRAAKVPLNELRRVVIAASVGNIIEWYDFYIFGSLASILAVKFFEKGHPVAAFLSTVAIFSVGFLIRPLGAFFFGWLGDKVGRKYTFIVTLTGMGVATALIGFVPTYQSIGLAAAFILFALRLIQGLCLGGEYGGAITYVAEHIEDEHRGYYTGWLQTSPTLGIVVSLATIIGIRTYLGVEAFNDWGWRLPFIISLLLVAIAIWIRLSLGETPIFQDMKARGRTTTNPWREAFLSSNFKYVAIASVVVLGQGCVWYSGQFWALYFLQTVKKLDVLTSSWIVGIALLIATPTLIFWGWLSDKVGRKPIILGGMALASLTYYPLYTALGNYTNPGAVNYPMAILIVVVLVNYVGMTYGPIGAFLAEFFPSRIRYTSVSVPYHIGNGWGGGLVPIVTTSMYLSTGSVGYALIYPIVVPAVMFLIAIFVMPETRKHSIWEEGAIEASPQPGVRKTPEAPHGLPVRGLSFGGWRTLLLTAMVTEAMVLRAIGESGLCSLRAVTDDRTADAVTRENQDASIGLARSLLTVPPPMIGSGFPAGPCCSIWRSTSPTPSFPAPSGSPRRTDSSGSEGMSRSSREGRRPASRRQGERANSGRRMCRRSSDGRYGLATGASVRTWRLTDLARPRPDRRSPRSRPPAAGVPTTTRPPSRRSR